MNNTTKIIIPFDFPFAILEYRKNPDPKKKLVYAVADGQYTYGPLSLFQYHNDEKYAKIIRGEDLPIALPCKIVDSTESSDDAIEILDENRGRIYVKEIDPEPERIRMKELRQTISECKNEIRSLKSIVLSEERLTRRSSSTKQQTQSTLVQRSVSTITKKNVHSPPRSQSVTSNRVLLKNVKSSGYEQQSPIHLTPKRSLRK